MNRVDFMKELRAGIVKLPYQEAEAALQYYEEYFDEAGAENEEKAIAELGNPSEIASQIMADFKKREPNFVANETPINLIKTNDTERMNNITNIDINKADNRSRESITEKRGLAGWQIIVLIFFLPIGLGLAGAALGVIISIEVIILSLGIVAFAFGVATAACIAAGVGMIGIELMTAIFLFGAGMVLSSLAIVFGMSTRYAFLGFNRSLISLFSGLFGKGRA